MASDKPTVLLVEDEAVLVLNVEDELHDAGFEVFSALNGAAAIAEIDSTPDRFSCLVIDIDLGRSINGWEVARHARLLSPNVVIVYMSGAAAQDWIVEGVPNSIMLKKPFANSQLTAAITRLMNDVSVLN